MERIGKRTAAGVAVATAAGLVAYGALHNASDAVTQPDAVANLACGYGGHVAFVCSTAARSDVQAASAWHAMTGLSSAPPNDLRLLASQVAGAYGDPTALIVGTASTTQVRGWAAVGALMRVRGRLTNPDALPESRKVWFIALKGRFTARLPTQSAGSLVPPRVPLVRTRLGLVVDQATRAPLLIAITNRPPRLARLRAPQVTVP